MLQLDYTMDEHQQRNQFHTPAVRSDLTRAIASLVPEIVEETTLAMAETFKPPVDSSTQAPSSCYTSIYLQLPPNEINLVTESTTLPLFPTMIHMVSRISNRAMVGTELCRNEAFLHAIVNFAETLVVYAVILNILPRPIRS